MTDQIEGIGQVEPLGMTLNFFQKLKLQRLFNDVISITREDAGRRISDFKGNYIWFPYFFFMGTHQ